MYYHYVVRSFFVCVAGGRLVGAVAVAVLASGDWCWWHWHGCILCTTCTPKIGFSLVET